MYFLDHLVELNVLASNLTNNYALSYLKIEMMTIVKDIRNGTNWQ
jgi:hypothetical protein